VARQAVGQEQRPTGYISEIRNLVSSCGPCNQSKGARDWRAWMTGKARHGILTRIARLELFEADFLAAGGLGLLMGMAG